MMQKPLTIVLLILLVILSFLLGFKWNSSHSDERLLQQQVQAWETEKDSIMQRNNQQDQFYNQQLDSLYAIIQTITHTKTLSQQQINTLKERLKQQEEARKTYLQNLSK